MDHTVASETYAAERYLLREMSPDERDEFEEHFFGCKVCSEDVQIVSLFVANATALFREQDLKASPAQKKARQWREWLKRDWTALLRLPVTVPTLAALALAAVVFYQDSVVIPHLLNPQSLNSALIFDGETRSSLPTETDDVPLRFQLLLSAPTDSPRVAVRVIDAKGKIVLGGFVESPGLNRVVDVYFPGKLNPGRYALIILTDQGGKPGIELGRGQFEITAKYTAKGE